jgi:hypothetical protein
MEGLDDPLPPPSLPRPPPPPTCRFHSMALSNEEALFLAQSAVQARRNADALMIAGAVVDLAEAQVDIKWCRVLQEAGVRLLLRCCCRAGYAQHTYI